MPKAVNTSGLLWQLAAELGALLVFAEVRALPGGLASGQGRLPNVSSCTMPSAALVSRPPPPTFPQHRYYGVSIPVNGSDAAAMQYLSVDQALLDSVHLIEVGSGAVHGMPLT